MCVGDPFSTKERRKNMGKMTLYTVMMQIAALKFFIIRLVFIHTLLNCFFLTSPGIGYKFVGHGLNNLSS